MNVCRHCGRVPSLTFLDLGTAPPSNAYLSAAQLDAPETFFPLRVAVCEACWLVQTHDYAGREALFTADYAYFSSFSASWLAHAERYVVAMQSRYALGADDLVVEVAANDGYLLQYFQQRGVPCLGVEPTAATARAARTKGLEIVEEFFGVALARTLVAQRGAVSLFVANNVLAHVPDLHDFVAGFAAALRPDGVATFEFPHLLKLVEGKQFDTIYHEHYSYLSLTAVAPLFARHGLTVFDVEELPTHGGSLRLHAQRTDSGARAVEPAVAAMLAVEESAGMRGAAFYGTLQADAERIKDDLNAYLIDCKRKGVRVAGYGAAAKGNTLLNFAGVRADLLAYVIDRNPAKAGGYLPGSRIPVFGEDHLKADRPDRILILPWNLRDEIASQLSYAGAWGARFVVAVPSLQEWDGGAA